MNNNNNNNKALQDYWEMWLVSMMVTGRQLDLMTLVVFSNLMKPMKFPIYRQRMPDSTVCICKWLNTGIYGCWRCLQGWEITLQVHKAPSFQASSWRPGITFWEVDGNVTNSNKFCISILKWCNYRVKTSCQILNSHLYSSNALSILPFYYLNKVKWKTYTSVVLNTQYILLMIMCMFQV